MVVCVDSRCYYSASITLTLRLMTAPPIELVSLLKLCDPLIGRKKSISDKIKPCQFARPSVSSWEILDDNDAFVRLDASADCMATIPAIVDLVLIINNVLVSKGATKGSIELITYTNSNKFTYRFKLSGLTFFIAASFDWTDLNNIAKNITLHRGYSTGVEVEIDGVNVAHSLYNAVRTMIETDLEVSKRRIATETAKVNSITKTLGLF